MQIIPEKLHIFRIYKGLFPLNFKNKVTKTINYPVKTWTNYLNKHLSREYIQMANKHVKRCSTSLIIREMQITAMVKYHVAPTRYVYNQKGR